mmetsp:Transcript_8126/g.18116  ORF Transcript_8126/g.18116 Transcript_8126/m.18116 type:complete len:151 (+) Transcript_8126:87-539(+)
MAVRGLEMRSRALVGMFFLAAALRSFGSLAFVGAPRGAPPARASVWADFKLARAATASMEDKVLQLSAIVDNDPVKRASALLNQLSDEEAKKMVELLDAPTLKELLGTSGSSGGASRSSGSKEDDRMTQKILGYILIAIGAGILFLVFTR